MDIFNIRNQKVEVASRKDPQGEGETAGASASRAVEQLREHNRKFERQAVDYPISVRLVAVSGATFDQGAATIRDMTPEGAYIGNLRLDHGRVPLEAFALHFRVEDGDLKGIEGSCKPVRIHSGEDAGFGVKFQQVYVKILGEDIDAAELGGGLL